MLKSRKEKSFFYFLGNETDKQREDTTTKVLLITETYSTMDEQQPRL